MSWEQESAEAAAGRRLASACPATSAPNCFMLSELPQARTLPVCGVCLGFARANSSSYDQRPFGIERGFGPHMFHPMTPVTPQKVETQAVNRRVDLLDQ
jgi:hypothetical protein